MKDNYVSKYIEALTKKDKEPQWYTPKDRESINACAYQDTINLITDADRKSLHK